MEPQHRLGVAALTHFVYEGGDLNTLRRELDPPAPGDAPSAGAMMDLSVIEQLDGNLAAGLDWQAKALETCRLYRTFRTEPGRLTLLVFAASIEMGGNTPIDFLLSSGEFDIVTYYPDVTAPDGALPSLPPHDVAFCAAPADDDAADAFFAMVRALTAKSSAPVLNLPPKLIKPERDTLPPLFDDVPGLRLPKTTRISRKSLEKALETGMEAVLLKATGRYPFVVRPVGSHAGLGLARIDSPDAFRAYLAERSEAQFFVCEYIDYASLQDGLFRKYRIVLIGGKAFPCHMAIADQWDVWYMNAHMQESRQKRREEAAFMDGFARVFNRRHRAAFTALAERIGLDYFGIDCAEDAEGNLVVFEADNALIVHDMDNDLIFPYKKAHMHAVFAAFEAMLAARAVPPQSQPENSAATRARYSATG